MEIMDGGCPMEKISLRILLWLSVAGSAALFTSVEALTVGQVLLAGPRAVGRMGAATFRGVIAVPKAMYSGARTLVVQGATVSKDAFITTLQVPGHLGAFAKDGVLKTYSFSRQHPLAASLTALSIGAGLLFFARQMGAPSWIERNYYGEHCLLHRAASLGDIPALKMLVFAGFDIESRDLFGRTPLLCAVLANKVDAVKFLLEAGADFYVVDNRGENIFHYAARSGHQEVLSYLRYLEGGRLLGFNSVATFLCSSSNDGIPALFYALVAGNTELVNAEFISIGDRNQTWGGDNKTLLHLCAEKGCKEAVAYLLSKKLAFFRDRLGRTPFYYAVINGYFDVAELLMQEALKGGPWPWKGMVNAKDHEGKTVLHHAYAQGNDAAVTFLLDKADIKIVDAAGYLPLSYALSSGFEALAYKSLKAIEKNGYDSVEELFFKAINNHNSDLVRFFLEKKFVTPAVKNRSGKTPIDCAGEAGYGDIIKLLIKFGYDINAVDEFGCTSLLNAVLEGCDAESKGLVVGGAYVVDKIKCLIEAGADIDKANAVGDTPILVAIRGGNLAIIKLLVEKGADLNCMNKKKETPLFIAFSQGTTCAHNNCNHALGNCPLGLVAYLAMHGADFEKPAGPQDERPFDVAQRRNIGTVNARNGLRDMILRHAGLKNGLVKLN